MPVAQPSLAASSSTVPVLPSPAGGRTRQHPLGWWPRSRCERLDEALTVIRALWSESQASFTGTHYQLSAAIAEPKPVQRPHPPITIAGEARRIWARPAVHSARYSSRLPIQNCSKSGSFQMLMACTVVP